MKNSTLGIAGFRLTVFSGQAGTGYKCPYGGGIMRYIELKLTKCRLFLTEAELISLLAKDQKLWKEGIRRGKHILRWRKEQTRKPKERRNTNDPKKELP
jgi:hypothetical protein